METPADFNAMARRFIQDFEFVADNFEDLVSFAIQNLSMEQKSTIRRFIEELLATGDVKLAQKIWLASEADICFYDEHIMKALETIKAALA